MAKNVMRIKRAVISLLLVVVWALALPRARADVFASQLDGSTQTWGAQYNFPQSLSLPTTIFVATEFGTTSPQAGVTLYNGMQMNLDGVGHQTSCDYLGDPSTTQCVPVHYDPPPVAGYITLVFTVQAGIPTVVVSRYDNVAGTYSSMSTDTSNHLWQQDAFMYGNSLSQTKFCMADTAENAYDCILGIQRPTISSLQQYQSDGKTAIPEGGTATGAVVLFGGVVQSSSTNLLRLQIDVEPAGTNFSGSGYLGTGNISSAFVQPGTAVMLSVPQPLPSGPYHWQASVVDSQGLQSQWQSLSNPPVGTDFSVSNPQNLPTDVYAAQLDGSAQNWGAQWYSFPQSLLLSTTIFVATEFGTTSPQAGVTLYNGMGLTLDGVGYQTTCDYLGDPSATSCVPVSYDPPPVAGYVSLVFTVQAGIPTVVVSRYDNVAGTHSSMSTDVASHLWQQDAFMYGNFLSQTKFCIADTAENAYTCMVSLGTVGTTTTISSSVDPSTYGQSLTLSSKIIPSTGSYIPTGTVSFSDSSTIVGTTALSGGIASLPISTLPAGLNPIIASYGGDANYAPSVSLVLHQQVNQATSATTLSSSPNPSYVNQPVTLSAIVTGQYGGTPTGSVTFQEGKKVLGTAQLVNAQGSFTYAFPTKGKFKIQAAYSGDSNYTPSTSARLTQIVQAGSLPQVGLPVLFVSGICEQPPVFDAAQNDVITFLQTTYPLPYIDATPYWVFYDVEQQQVAFEAPGAYGTQTWVPSTSRFFAVAFDDYGVALVQDFDVTKVANNSIYGKADELAHIIWAIKAATGVPRVLLVAHSMGGLVSRAYIEALGTYPYLQDISTLITLDTPHGGAEIAFWSNGWLGFCAAQDTLDKRQMQPSGPDSIIPKLNYFVPGASPLPNVLAVYSIDSYWTISTALGRLDGFDQNTDNVLLFSEQDLKFNLNNPGQNSQSKLSRKRNPFDATSILFSECGVDWPYVLHSLDCTGSAPQTYAEIEDEIGPSAVMTQNVAVAPSSVTVGTYQSVQFSATTPSKKPAVWSLLEGPNAGVIDNDGYYIAGNVPGVYHVVAIDSVKSNDYGIATVTVTE